MHWFVVLELCWEHGSLWESTSNASTEANHWNCSTWNQAPASFWPFLFTTSPEHFIRCHLKPKPSLMTCTKTSVGAFNSTLKSEQTQQRTHVLGLWPFGRICAPKPFKHPWKPCLYLFFFKDQHVFWKAGNDKIAGALQKAFVRRKIYSRMCSLQNTMFSSCIIAAFCDS